MTDKIKHLGIVESIDGSRLKVRILQTSACSSCSVKGHCSASEAKEKLIDVYNVLGLSCQSGQHVVISGTVSMGMKAVLLAFVIPFLVLVVSLFVCMMLTNDEMTSALISLCMLIPYYLFIYPFSYIHLRAHEPGRNFVCRLLLEKKTTPTVSTSLRMATHIYYFCSTW